MKEIDPEKWIKGMEEAFAELFETIDPKESRSDRCDWTDAYSDLC